MLSTCLGEECVNDKVEDSSKEFVPHQNSCEEIPENKGTCVFSRIFPDIKRSKEDSDEVEGHNERKEFPW